MTPMTPLIKKIMAMARKTGDRCIMIDPSGEEAFVLMDLADYEKLRGVTSAPVPITSAIPVQNEPKKEPTANRLTAFPNAYNIKPVIVKQVDEIPFEAFVDEGNGLAELSEEKIRQEERFYLEPLE